MRVFSPKRKIQPHLLRNAESHKLALFLTISAVFRIKYGVAGFKRALRLGLPLDSITAVG